jgi:hypothetical protein
LFLAVEPEAMAFIPSTHALYSTWCVRRDGGGCEWRVDAGKGRVRVLVHGEWFVSWAQLACPCMQKNELFVIVA